MKKRADMPRGWIGVDLDATLAVYPSNFPNIGPPIPMMVERVKGWLAEGYEVRIVTARVGPVRGDQEKGFAKTQRQLIEAWCLEHLGRRLRVTATKDFGMLCLYDDRCVQVESNTGRLLAHD